MSRAAWVGILLLGAGVGLVAFLLTRGLPDEAKGQAAALEARLVQARSELASSAKRIDAAIAADAAYLARQPEVKEARAALAEREARLKAVSARVEAELAPLIKRDKHKERAAVWQATFTLGGELDKVEQGLAAIDQPLQRLVHYKENHQDLLQQARSQLDGIGSYIEDTAVASALVAALTECPASEAELRKKADELTSEARQLSALRPELDQLAAAEPLDYAALGRKAEAAIAGAKALRAKRGTLLSDLGTLGQSKDKLLVDMREAGGTYYHKYQTIEAGRSATGGFEPVSRATFDKHRDHLGMSIYSKPECVLASEAVTVASPPGYSYVGNPRYGQWEQRGGQSFWVFYGRYALMRDLFWGAGSYRPINRTVYTSYRGNVRSGKSYFGGSNEFGTRGSETRKKYSSSSYYKSAAARASSGSSSSSSGRTGYSGSKYSGSSTRSGGYRSSSYRSSSSGGSGK